MRPRADTLLIWTGAPCSYGCRTCPIAPGSAPVGIQPAALQDGLTARLGGAPASGPLAVLVGGEPFLRPDLLRLLAAVRAAGCTPGVVTTGRALVYPHVRERLRKAGLAYLRMQIFGAGDTHDAATGVPGAFAQALAGLRAWVEEAGATCDVDVALYGRGRPLAALVSEIEEVVRALPAARVQLVVAMDNGPGTEGSPLWRETVDLFASAPFETPPKEGGSSGRTGKSLEIEPEPVRAEEASSFQRPSRSPPAPSATFSKKADRGGCAALGHWNEDPTRPVLVFEGGADGGPAGSWLTLAPPRPRFVGATPPASCLGATAALARAAPRRTRVRANSFNFVRTATAVPLSATAAACTADAAAGRGDPDRQLWLVDGDRLVLHVTDTADFDADEIAQVKTAWSHLFVDRAPAGVLDDFTEGLRRVLPDPVCASCSRRAACGRRVREVDGPPFAREEAWIRAHVAALRGRVLDVGCGEQLYRDVLGPLVRSGGVEYHGLDPDGPSLASLRAALPQGHYACGGIEDFHGERASYDHILCLRSLNHVVDVDEAVARMAELLEPEGQLLLVECTPFALLRGVEQVAAADRAPRAGHQHFRNVSSTEVLPFVRRHGLRVVHHSAASLRTTNQWILLLAQGEHI